jgi:hypothetical protein
MDAKMDDLDLTSAEDRAIYRTRVDEEFKMMKGSNLREEATRIAGTEPRGNTRREATRIIAAARIMKKTGVWYG